MQDAAADPALPSTCRVNPADMQEEMKVEGGGGDTDALCTCTFRSEPIMRQQLCLERGIVVFVEKQTKLETLVKSGCEQIAE